MKDLDLVIRKNLMAYGFLPMLLVLETLINKEKYELCHIIWKVYSSFYRKFADIPKRFTKEAVTELKEVFYVRFGLSGHTTINNLPYYAEMILEDIEKNFTPTPASKIDFDKLSEFDKVLVKCLNTKK
jgi:hypothetical protein